VWHKGKALPSLVGSGADKKTACFKCTTCSSTLTLKNFTRKGEAIYCAQHVPKEGHTQVADSVLTAHSTKSQAANMGGKIAKASERDNELFFLTLSPQVHRDEAGYAGGGGDEGHHEAPAEEAPADE
jgi:hypothetical protein